MLASITLAFTDDLFGDSQSYGLFYFFQIGRLPFRAEGAVPFHYIIG